MRLTASAVCALFIAALFFGMRWYASPSVQGDENFAVIKGRVASPGTPCRRSARSSTFELQVTMGGTNRSHRFLCSERVREAAVPGSEVILHVQAVTAGNQGVWLIRGAQVDGRELFKPRGLFGPPTTGEMVFLGTLAIMLFVAIATVEGPREARRKSGSPRAIRKTR